VALKGETSDNLPGVPGVGDKTAAQLINKYGDIEQVIAHAAELTPKLREAITKNAEQVRINKELGHLLDDVQLDLDPVKLRLESWDEEAVRTLFTSLEFRSLHERLREVKFHAPTNWRSPGTKIGWRCRMKAKRRACCALTRRWSGSGAVYRIRRERNSPMTQSRFVVLRWPQESKSTACIVTPKSAPICSTRVLLQATR
jgi:hypothetical protein